MKLVHVNVGYGNEEKSWPQIVAILTAGVLCLASGVLFAWPSPFMLKISQDKVNYNITEHEASYFTVVNMLGIIILAPFLVPVAKLIGRKPILLMTAIPYTVSFLVKYFGRNLWLLYFARLSAGFGDALLFTAFPVYVGEVATPKVRGIWGNTFVVASFLGYFLVNVMGSHLTVPETSLVGLGIVGLFLVTFAFMPESPYYLIMKNEDEQAKECLRRLRRKHDVEKEFELIKTAVARQIAEAGSWKDLVMVKTNRKALLAGIFLRIGQQFSGVLVFTSYTQFIFAKTGTDIDSSLAAQIYTATTFVVYVCACYFSNKLGRRKAFMISMSLSAIVLLSESTYFLIEDYFPEVNLDSAKWFPLAGMLIFVLVSSFGIGITPTLMISELFSVGIKAHAVSSMTITYGAMVFVANNLFYAINSATGLFGPFMLFGACDILSTIVAYFLVPETKDKTLEDIQIMLKNGRLK